jgi:putative ABC transport system permease protein
MLKQVLLAVRALKNRPGYTTSILTTLTAGIGATTVMFSLVDAALLRPLPFAEPERLVFLTGVAGPQRAPRGASFPEITDWRALNTTLEDVVLYDETSLNLRHGTEAIRLDAEMVSAGYFRMLGAAAALGRTFLPEEDAVVDRNAVAVISHALWQTRFGADPAVLQRTIHLNDRSAIIVGVMPEGFAGVSFDTDVWVPSMMVSLTSNPAVVQNRGTRWLGAIGRVRAGTPLPRVQEDMNRVAALLEQQHPDTNRERGVQVDRVQDALVGTTAGLMTALFGAVLLLLAVACANVASLQLARATGRRREVAVRFALGARRSHVLRELLAESLVLALIAGVLGTLMATWVLGGIVSMTPAGALPRYVEPAIDLRAVAFALVTSLLVGALVSIIPTLVVGRGDLAASMKEGSRSAEPGLGSIRRPSLQQALVVGQLALAMTLLSGAALMVRSLERQLNVPLRFDPQGVTVARITLPAARFPAAERAPFADRLLARVRELPGVSTAAIATSLPFTGNSSASILVPEGATGEPASQRYFRNFVTPAYFNTLGISMTHGRPFTDQNRAGTTAVAIVNESAARRIWGTDDAIGRRFRLGDAQGPLVEIVGIAADARYRDLTTDLARARVEPDVYFPFAQRTDRDIEIAVRTADGATVPAASLQRALRSVDPGLPLYAMRPLNDALKAQTSTARFGSMLLTLFSVGTVLLSAVGLYGLIAYVVGRSRREIAIRLALGANARRVAALIVGNGMILVVAGIAIGTAGAVGAARALETQLFQSSGLELRTQVTVALMLIVIAFLASALSTRRAVRVDPQLALRAE